MPRRWPKARSACCWRCSRASREVLIAILLAFFLYRDGPAIAQRAEAALARLAGDQTRHIVEVIGGVTRGVVYGLLGTALAQGLMTWVGSGLSGVPRPALLAVIAGCISIMPVGAPLVWIPATLWLFAQGQTGWAIFLGLYGAFGISSADNVIRPWLIRPWRRSAAAADPAGSVGRRLRLRLPRPFPWPGAARRRVHIA